MTDRLTALDATFLELEQLDEGANMHIGSVMVFDPTADGGAPSLTRLCELIGRRLACLPRYSHRLSSERTGGLAWPRWIEDARFDVRNHVRRAAVASPGGEQELLDWAGDFFSHRLDRSRPLWEMVLLEGLQDGSWALATKTHHALVDGVGSVGVAQAILDVEPDPAPWDAPARPVPVPSGAARRPLLPRPPEAVSELLRTGARAAAGGLHSALHPGEAFERSRALTEVVVRDELLAAPSTSINAPIGATRRYAVVRASLAELKAIGRAFDGSVNDVLLAACTAGLRRLLLERGETPPEAGMRAMVPMNVRSEAERLDLGNRVSSLFVELPVAVPDPLVRVRSIIAETARLKASGAATGAATMIDLAGLAPPVLHAMIARSLYATRLFNVTITNVPGPRIPLYSMGTRLREVHPFVPLAADHALGVAIVSYDGQVVLGLCADRDSTPDLAVFGRGVEDGLAELRMLADAAAGPRGASTAPPRRAARRGAAPAAVG
jgi:WS/DGAT/MGAT family acyltransferase